MVTNKVIKKSQPISRVLSWTIIYLGCLSPYTSSDLPGSQCGPHLQLKLRGFLFGLAPSGVFPATDVTTQRGALLPHHFTLTCTCNTGGIFSVALSVGSHLPGVTWHFALWSPDFPPPITCYEQRLFS